MQIIDKCSLERSTYHIDGQINQPVPPATGAHRTLTVIPENVSCAVNIPLGLEPIYPIESFRWPCSTTLDPSFTMSKPPGPHISGPSPVMNNGLSDLVY